MKSNGKIYEKKKSVYKIILRINNRIDYKLEDNKLKLNIKLREKNLF